jgi:hypothetical protein
VWNAIPAYDPSVFGNYETEAVILPIPEPTATVKTPRAKYLSSKEAFGSY